MKIHLDRDFMCPFFVFTDKGKSVRFEIGDRIHVYYPDNLNTALNSIHFSEYSILNMTAKIIVLECYGRCYYIPIEELEKRIKI